MGGVEILFYVLLSIFVFGVGYKAVTEPEVFSLVEGSHMKELLEKNGYTYVRQMKNGEWVGIAPMLYTWGLFVGMDEFGYKRRYCYEKFEDVMKAAVSYEGEGDPIGDWIKVKEENDERMGPGAKG